MPPDASNSAFIAALSVVVGPQNVLTDADVRAGYETDWTGRFSGTALAVVRPGDTAQVAAVLRLAHRTGVAVVPQGGNTGLVGGSVPRGGEIVLSTRRLDRVGPVDVEAGEVVVGAGATLKSVQRAARDAGWELGIDLAARGSATIGGMVATNAGGVHVLRYGSMRAQVIGVEAATAAGDVIGSLPALVKDNTGYHWDGLLAGSEGTLAVVTRVHLQLVPPERSRVVALVGLASVDDAVALSGRIRRVVPGTRAIEVMFDDGVDMVRAHAGLPAPFADASTPPILLLVEVGSTDPDPTGPAATLQSALDATDVAVLASAVALDAAGAARLWRYRELHTEAVNALGVPHKMDVTVPLARWAEFVAAVRPCVTRVWAEARTVLFGHLGDGNVHVNVVGPPPDDDRVDRAVLTLATSFGGSISAEHGIGTAKRDLLGLTRRPEEIAVMRAVKQALDPAGILNPGVLLPPE